MPSMGKKRIWEWEYMEPEQQRMIRQSIYKYFIGVCFPLFIILIIILEPSTTWRNLGILALASCWITWAGFRIWDYVLFRPIWDAELPTVAELKEADEEEIEPNERPFFGFTTKKSKITHSIKIVKDKKRAKHDTG